MKYKIILLLVISILVIAGIRSCYLKDYVTILKYPETNHDLYFSPDSIKIAPYFGVENSSTLIATINFESIRDSLFLEDLTVTVYSTDKPEQSIRLRKVETPVLPIVVSNGNLIKLQAKSFLDLPVFYKTIRNSSLPYASILFYFKTREINNTDIYHFKLSGTANYKGTRYRFEKDYKTERKVEYRPYRMMT